MGRKLTEDNKQSKGSRLRSWRERERLTLADMGALTGYSASMLSLVEGGKRRLSREGKVMLSRRLGVPLRDLFAVEQVTDEEASA